MATISTGGLPRATSRGRLSAAMIRCVPVLNREKGFRRHERGRAPLGGPHRGERRRLAAGPFQRWRESRSALAFLGYHEPATIALPAAAGLIRAEISWPAKALNYWSKTHGIVSGFVSIHPPALRYSAKASNLPPGPSSPALETPSSSQSSSSSGSIYRKAPERSTSEVGAGHRSPNCRAPASRTRASDRGDFQPPRLPLHNLTSLGERPQPTRSKSPYR